MRRVPWCAALIGLALTPAPALARRFALVVAENRPQNDRLAPLRFADDDGLRYRALLQTLGAEVTLLTVLDEDTQRRNPAAARGLRAPTLAAVVESMARINAQMTAAHAEGEVTDFYFVFAGHGESGPNGEGRMHLRDGVLTRRAFLETVVSASTADFNHLVIDACHAAALVSRRGGEDDGYRERGFEDVVQRYLDDEDLSAHPNTGALLASSRGEETHEWEVFRAGIFSHQVRSGLTGVADTNGDGVIEYSELAAYVAAANATVRAPGARPEVVTFPPALDRHRPLADLADGPTRYLRLPARFLGRAWLEDANGDRYADFNASGEAPMLVALADAGGYYLRRGTDEAHIDDSSPGAVDGGRLPWRPRALGTRGAVDDAFRRDLYGVPFGPSFYQGFVAQAGWLPAIRQREGVTVATTAEASRETRFGAWPWVSTGLALAAGGTAIYLGVDAQQRLGRFEDDFDRTGRDDPSARDDITLRRDLANGLGATALLATTAAITLFLLDEPARADGFSVAPTPGGFVLGAEF